MKKRTKNRRKKNTNREKSKINGQKVEKKVTKWWNVDKQNEGVKSLKKANKIYKN